MPIGKQKKKEDEVVVPKAHEENLVMENAKRSLEAYEENKDQITTQPAKDFLEDNAFQLEKNQEELKGGEADPQVTFETESLSNILVSSLQISEMAKVLKSAGYSDDQTREILEKNYNVSEEAYVQARVEGQSEEEARKVAREAQKQHLSPIYTSMGKEHKKKFEDASGLVLRQQEIGALALASGEKEAINAAFNAKTEQEQRAVVRDYSLMTAFVADAFFVSTQLIFAAGAFGAVGEVGELESPAEAGLEELDFFLQEQQKQQDETQTLQAMDDEIAELMDKSQEDAQEPISELDEKTQEKLGEYGVSADATIAEAIEFLKTAREKAGEEIERVQDLQNPEYFVKDDEGNWTLQKDEREGAQYSKMPAFYPKEDALEIIEDAKPMIAQSPMQFSVLVAREFAGDQTMHIGTAKEVMAEADFSNPDAPETVVLQSLMDPGNEELKEKKQEILENPLNTGIQAALLEAYARAVSELINMQNAA